MLAIMLDNIRVKKKKPFRTRATTTVYPKENRDGDGEEAICIKLVLST